MTLGGQENILEIKALVALAEGKSSEQREFLYRKIGNFLISETHSFSMPEKELMVDIICRITTDVEKSIRSHFARQLADKDDIPKALMVFLANDEIEVALPILKDCGLLSEPDLLEIIKHRSLQHQFAVAAREDISESVCQAICDLGNSDMTVTLLENHGAQMPLSLLSYLGEKSEIIPEYQRPLLQRPFLPQPIAEKMYRWVSIALREYIVEKFDVDARALDVKIEDRNKTIQAISKESDPSVRLVEKLFSAGELTRGFMVKSLHQGEMDLFELSFAKLIGVDLDTIKYALYGEKPEILAVACRKIDLDRAIFKMIYEVTVSVQGKEVSSLFPAAPAPIELYDLLTVDAADKAMQHQDFMAGNVKYAETS